MAQTLQTVCCIVGGGPAGMMAGFLLARAGVDVVVMEKHKDFLRDFRGDTIHPSTLELMYELGLLEEFLREPHQELRHIEARFGDRMLAFADLTHVPTHCKFLALMPQWDFLNFLARHGSKYPGFHLHMETEGHELVFDGDRVAGVRAKSLHGEIEVRALLTLAADGRGSTLREQAGFEVVDLGAPIDVFWFRISKEGRDPQQTFGNVSERHFMVLLDRGDYWQCAYLIRKGAADAERARGLEVFRANVLACAPYLGERVKQIESWDQVKLLSVKVDHLRKWHREGLLCIGDSAHAMSPVGGVGINLALQDAVAAANLLYAKLLEGHVTDADLASVQRRRERPTRLTQRVQVFMHKHLLERIFDSPGVIDPPAFMKLANEFPRLRRLPARIFGIGFRQEHVRTPEAAQPVSTCAR